MSISQAQAATFVYVSNAEDGDIGMYTLEADGSLKAGEVFGMNPAADCVCLHSDTDQIIGSEQFLGFGTGNHTATNSSRA